MSSINHQIRLASRPFGLAKRSDWSFTEEFVKDPAAGEFLVRIQYLSLDPAMRGWMSAAESYIPPVGIGEVMRAGGVGQIIASQHPQFAVGEWVTGKFGVQEYFLSNGRDVAKIDTKIASPTVYLNALGMPGMTAYFGLLDIGAPKAGETVVVSGAAGAVGALVGQIAKLRGCRVVGIAGGPKKCRYIKDELGFDAAIDYKNEILDAALRQHAPNGIDIYFDNVGGDTLDSVLKQINLKARIIICGAISQYNSTTGVKGPSNYLSLLFKRARMEGMVVFDYADRYSEGVKDMSRWLAEGKLKSLEDVVFGLEHFPEALLKLFKGENFGKLVLDITQ